MCVLRPSMFGLICRKDKKKLDGFYGKVFDVNTHRWHDCPVDAAGSGEVIPVGAADGGLICFVSETIQHPLFIIVMNPLTGRRVRLPSLLPMNDLLRPVPLGMGGVRDGKPPTVWAEMIQLTMDSQKRQHYKVFVAGYVKCGYRHSFAQVYDSRTKEWTIVGSEQRSWERISGCGYTWENNHGDYARGMRMGPSVYDFAGMDGYNPSVRVPTFSEENLTF